MAYFTKDKLEKLVEARGVRAEYAREMQRMTTDNVYLLEHAIKRVLPLARDEAQDFADSFGEPMPGHVQRALDAEISMWERLKEGLVNLRTGERTSEVVDAYAVRARSYLCWQYDLIFLEKDMVTSCLVRHYERELESILDGAAQDEIHRI